jgi:hypothetical protein
MEQESKYRAYDEFTWNPDMSLEDFTLINVLREERKIDLEIAEIYLNWMRYVEAHNTLTFNYEKFKQLPAEWLEAENIAGTREKAKVTLDNLLKDYKGNSTVVDKIKAGLRQRENSYNLTAGCDFPVVVNADKTSVPREGILILRNGGFAEKKVRLSAGKYMILAILKCFSSAACKVNLIVNGQAEAVFPVEPTNQDYKSATGWLVPSAQININKDGLYNLRIQLAEGDCCAFNRLKITPW